MLTFRGETKCFVEWAETTGIPAQIIGNRINTSGWDVEKSLTTPVAMRSKRRKD